MKKGMIITLALALLMPLALQAQAGPGGQGGPKDGSFCDNGSRMGGGKCGGHGGHGGPGMRGDGPRLGRLVAAAEEIGLSDQQVEKLKTFQTEFKMEQIDAKAELEKAQVQLKDVMRNDDASEMDVNRAIDRVAGLRADMQKMRYAHRQQIKSTLTEEQLDKLETLRKEKRQGRFENCDGQGKKGARGGRGGGHGRI